MSGKKYKLSYFNVRGRAEIIRLIFAATGTPYEDRRVGYEEWPEFKKNTPTGVLPLLEFEDKVLDQSMAIVRYLSNELGIHGKDNWEQALVDNVIDKCQELFREMAATSPFYEKDEDKIKALRAKMANETVPKFVKDIVKFMTKYGCDGFAVGNSLTTADLALYDILTMYQEMKPTEKDPKLAAHFKKIGDIPGIKEWVANRPVTQG